MEEKSSKGKGVSIVMILLAIVLGFGFVIGLTQTSGASNLNNQDSEISHYSFDENGVLLSYNGTLSKIEIPATYSLSSTVEEVKMTSSSVYTLVDRAATLGISNYTIENQTGNYTDEYGNVSRPFIEYWSDFHGNYSINGDEMTLSYYIDDEKVTETYTFEVDKEKLVLTDKAGESTTFIYEERVENPPM